MILTAIIIAFPVVLWLLNKAEARLEAHDRRRAADYAAIQARLDADVDRIIERRPAVYDWACEGDCPDCNPDGAVDPLAEWERLIRTPGLLEDRIAEELT